MSRRNRFLAAGAAVLAVGAGGAGLAIAAGSGEDANETDVAITGSSLDKASAAALDHLGGGTVSGTEVGDEESYYEVEVTRDDGSEVDVQLDRDFNVVGDESDAGESGDDD